MLFSLIPDFGNMVKLSFNSCIGRRKETILNFIMYPKFMKVNENATFCCVRLHLNTKAKELQIQIKKDFLYYTCIYLSSMACVSHMT